MKVEKVKCSVCGHIYQGYILAGPEVYPRKHYLSIPTITSIGITAKKGRKILCDGSDRPGISLEETK